MRRQEHLVAGASASKVCTLHLSSGFALLDFPRSCTGLLWFFEFTSPSESGDQSEYGCDRGLAFSASASGVHSRRSSVVATLRSCRRCGWLCASWSAGTPRRRLARIDRPVYMSGGACYCWRLVLLPCLCCPRSKHVQRRVQSLLAIVRHREALWKVFCSPSCSSRAAPVASLRLFVHPSSARLQLRGLGVAACSWVTACCPSSVVHLTSFPCTGRTSPCSSSSDTVSFSTLFTLQRDVSPCTVACTPS